MREVTYYVADDGKKFLDESECREYEFSCEAKHGKWTLLNKEFKVLDNLNPRAYEDASYVFLPTDKDGEKLSELWDGEVVDCRPDFLEEWSIDAGLWAYDWNHDTWYHVGERIAEYQKIADQAMSAVNGV